MTINNKRLYDFSILIPCHNSASNLDITFTKLESRITSSKFKNKRIEIIFIENGSKDQTLAKLNKLKVEFPTLNSKIVQSEKGLGHALRKGSSYAEGSKIAFIPDDLSYDLQELDVAFRNFNDKSLLILSKYIHPFIYNRSWSRIIPGLVFSFLKELILGVRVWDSQSTFVGEGPVVKALLGETSETGFLITTEIIAYARLRNIQIIEIPAEKINVQLRGSTLKSIDLVNMIVGLVKIKSRLKGKT